METSEEHSADSVLHTLHLQRPARGWKLKVNVGSASRTSALYTYNAPQGDGNSKMTKLRLRNTTLHLQRPARGWKHGSTRQVEPDIFFTLTTPRKGMETLVTAPQP